MPNSPSTPNLRVRYAKIVTPQGAYQLTPADVLWAARSAFYEGGSPADVLWAETQRFTTMRGSYSTFAAFVQAFSQPINPKWRRTGEFCRAGGKYASTDACSQARLARRDTAASITWSAMYKHKPELVAVVVAWANGQLPNPVPRVTNFADTTVAAHWLKNNDGDVFKHGANVFIVEGLARTWDRNHVTLQADDGAIASADGVQAGAGAAGGALAVFLNSLLRPLNPKV
jgi:hypothetical protein